MKYGCLLIGLIVAIGAPRSAIAEERAAFVADDSPEGAAFFESKIRPRLVKHCYECHSAQSESSEGELRLDSRARIRQGGARGPAVVPGDPAASWLLTSISHTDADLRMPPKREKLPAEVIADFQRWIEMGAPDPRDAASERQVVRGGQAARDLWAYRRPVAVEPPAVVDQEWPRRPLDAFILASLQKHQLSPSPDAAPHTLQRRLSFDLIGLPPEPDDVVRFQKQIAADGIDAALAQEVDRLLASPRFGERWGRHWLDVARFAESSGTEANISFPYAWRYRDYVIDGVNDDIPFDRFLVEQIAGDLLPSENDAERARLLIATGFLAVGPKNLDATDEAQFRADVIDEQIDAVTRAVLGSSLACARCHDHKFDPFSMQDYYALAGIFASTKTYFGTAVSPSNRIGGDPLLLPALENQVVLHASIPQERVDKLKQQLATLLAEKAEMESATKARFAGEKPVKEFTIQDALRVFWQSGGIEGELEKVSDSGRALPLAMGVQDGPSVVDAPLLERGDVSKPKDKVARAFPAVMQCDAQPAALPSDQSGRLELARWLVRADHPLTSRVIVNRVWSHLLGAGLVATVDNFGSTGEAPSHPELLDALAIQFVGQGWSVKRLIREIVLSRTYRQSSGYRNEAFAADPDNRWLWRAPKRRLEAECIRDAALTASGELDLQRPAGSLVGRVIGDKPISLIGLDQRLPKDLDGAVHRSVYLPVIRDRLPDVLELFDFAEASLVTGRRETTNVPVQALYLLNSPFIQKRAEALAARLRTHSASVEQQVRRGFLICLSREPEPEESAAAAAFLKNAGQTDSPAADAPSPALVSFCQALFCTAEFRNLD